MSTYNPNEIEKKWRELWRKHETYKVEEDATKEKYYVLDMFPYPSGAGLHVGHPLGYIASDIFSRYKKLKGYNVLHPMGYDSFGLPAEQYAIQTGQHPAVTTEKNIERYREQLDQIGFSYDWSREVRTSNPNYYKWTQWIFKQIFNSWYNKETDKAEDISTLEAKFKSSGNVGVSAECDETETFTAAEWNSYDEKKQQDILMNYRLAFLADSWVNWCPALGTVLANDEIKDGVSERGGHPVEQKLMRQWSMRITAYADRLLKGLDEVDFSDALKEQQRNWIGKSVGASVKFSVQDSNEEIEVFTTRPDTIYGVSFMVLAPEHPLVDKITTSAQREEVENYQKQAALKSERDRQANVKEITGANTGAFAIHPFTREPVQIWIGDYVLASYGTGAVMAVPAGDQRDYNFAKHFDIPIPNIFKGVDISEEACADKEVVLDNSDFLNDLTAKDAIDKAIEAIEEKNIGKKKVNFRLRDAIFSRQRYWGEPFPVYFENGIARTIEDEYLPITLPEVDKYLPTEDGEPPLGNATKWSWCTNKKMLKDNDKQNGKCTWPMELNTMPGWAGSSWYFLRYMDPNNDEAFADPEKIKYWNQVDLYVGGAEHATGHLLYSRFWTKFLFDKGFINFSEPFKKLINQGMILGRSSFVKLYNIIPKYDNQSLDEMPYTYKNIWLLVSGDLDFDLNDLKQSYPETYKQILQELKLNLRTLNEDSISASIKDEIVGASNNEFRIDINSIEHGNQVNFDILGKNPVFSFVNSKSCYKIFNKSGEFLTNGSEVEKMSKSKYNVQTPDDLVEKFGADTLRCYEMFLGPLEQYKPWDVQGINGVNNFLKKFWRLFHSVDEFNVSEEAPNPAELKALHKVIKKNTEDLDRHSFNTVVSNLMIAVNELNDLKCNKKEILEPLTVLLSPYAPHITEELWQKLGNEQSITKANWPEYNESYLVENSHNYPVSFNGKMRFKVELPTNLSKDEIEAEILGMEKTQGYLEGKTPKKVIVVPKKIVNIVV